MTGNISNIIADLDEFDFDNGFGFVVADGQRYYFEANTRCKVGGTLSQPTLTDERSDELPRFWVQDNFEHPRLILRVEQGTGRRRAVAWGLLPRRSWLDELRYRRTLNQFVGGTVDIEYLYRGQVHTQVQGRLLAPPQLFPGTPWQLSLTYFSDHGIQAVTSTFDLKDAKPSSRCDEQQYGVSMFGETRNDYVGITLTKNTY